MSEASLVIVESPTKAETIQKYLGAGYRVVATAGHFRDLPEEALGVDLATFEPQYELQASRSRQIAAIRAALKGAGSVYLATDADREGEAISWHLVQAFHLGKARRIRFTEITPHALQAAVAAAGPLDQALVDAQQARRVLDRLVGYQVSPLLRVFGPRHAAGRVQTATLHLVVQRELDREAFQAVPYWTLTAHYLEGFDAPFARKGEKGGWAPAHLSTETEAKALATQARGAVHQVDQVSTRPVERKPQPPFTTSTLQQAAHVALGMKPDRTMLVAQHLFERGLISYHRTDSVALSEDALAMARAFIAKDFPEGLPDQPVRYRVKATAQGAHEAIRPTALKPAVPEGLEPDYRQLYDLIRRRFLASQCRPAVLAETEVLITAGPTTWRATGKVVTFQGFLHYLERDETSEEGEKEPSLPAVAKGQVLALQDVKLEAKKTQPPSRFTRATLIREMERLGIGRPATFVSSVEALFEREYLVEEKKQLKPTLRGRGIDRVLGQAFHGLGEAAYTAQMEAQLDRVAAGELRWKKALTAWYTPFSAQLTAAPAVLEAEARRAEIQALLGPGPQVTEKACPLCQKPLLLRKGKNGDFLACTGFPACTYTGNPDAQPWERPCPACEGPMEALEGKYGRYARCMNRACRARLDLASPTSEACPRCGAPMRNRGTFLSCTRYPECKGGLDRPEPGKAAKVCPRCQKPLRRRLGAKGAFWGCSTYPDCRHTQEVTGERPVPKARAVKTKAS